MNHASSNDLKIISRLVLQRILSSDAIAHLRKKSYESCQSALLSETPENGLCLSFSTDTASSAYGTGTVELKLNWSSDNKEIVDLEGNAWVTYKLLLSADITSCYNLSHAAMLKRFEIFAAVSNLAAEITEMVPDSVKIIALNPEQRVARDEKLRIEAAANLMSSVFQDTEHRRLRVGLRINGKSRAFRRELLPGVLPGTYKFNHNEGTSRRPKYKTYSVFVPENVAYLCSIKRIA